MKVRQILPAALVLFLASPAMAAAEHAAPTEEVHILFLWLALLLLFGKLGSLVERIGFPAVLGEILVGTILGGLHLVGFNVFEAIKASPIIGFLAELGVAILLFQIGLESNVDKMVKAGGRALAIAATGVVVTFGLGFLIIPLLIKGLSVTGYLFLAGMFTATSAGISARTFKDLGKMQTPEAQLVLGAAIIDDVIGLIILAVLSAMVTTGKVDFLNTGAILGKAVGFLVVAILAGQKLAPLLGSFFAKINTQTGMKLIFAFSFGLVMAYFAKQLGLAPIIGAFAAGLVLDPVHFKGFKDPEIVDELRALNADTPASVKERIGSIIEHHSDRHVEDIVAPLGIIFIPVFFILTGMHVDVSALVNVQVLGAALALVCIAVIGKMAAGLAAGSARKFVVGWGMVPRGEVQLIFAAMGRTIGIVSNEVFAMVVIVVFITTILTPLALSSLLKPRS